MSGRSERRHATGTLVHGRGAVGADGVQKVCNQRINTSWSPQGKGTKRRYALPDDKRKRVAEVHLGRDEVRDVLIGSLIALLFITLFALAGHMELISERAYQESWAEANGIIERN